MSHSRLRTHRVSKLYDTQGMCLLTAMSTLQWPPASATRVAGRGLAIGVALEGLGGPSARGSLDNKPMTNHSKLSHSYWRLEWRLRMVGWRKQDGPAKRRVS